MTRVSSSIALSLTLAAGLTACATVKEAPAGPPPELLSQDLAIDQDLSTFNLKLDGQARSEQAATIEKAHWELVVDGKVVKSGDEALDVKLAPGAASPFELKTASRYVESAEELTAMSTRGGSLLAALRGTLQVRQGTQTHLIDFARSREVRTPRLPSVKMHTLDGARYSAEEVSINCYLGVVNPNPFVLHVDSLTYKVMVAGKQVSEGTRGQGDTVDPASTGVFDIQVPVSKESVGPEVKKLIASGSVPYVITGELKGELYSLPYRLEGAVKIYDSSK